MGHRDILDGYAISRPPPGFNPRTVQPVASRYTGTLKTSGYHKLKKRKTRSYSMENSLWKRLQNCRKGYGMMNVSDSSQSSSVIWSAVHRGEVTLLFTVC
jgi:hypothetical protein